MRKFFRRILLGILSLFLTHCETMEVDNTSTPARPEVVVEGTLFYPDETGFSYRVPSGAQIIGAGGTDCVFIIESGGSVAAHCGTNNSYRVKSGGHFRGFTHPATNCTITAESGAIVEQEQLGPGTTVTGS